MEAVNPRVSIIVPNYNHARYLPERLESIYNQTFKDFEVILLDDASTDGSKDILRNYSQRANTRLSLNRKNSGSTFAQWNKGVRLAAGEFVWIAESDDVADPAFLKSCVDKLEHSKSIGLVYADSWMIDEYGNKIEKRSTFLANKLNELPEQGDYIRDGATEIVTRIIRWNTISNASAVVFKRKNYLDAGGADETMKLTGDWLMWIKILEHYDYGYVANPLNYNRTHSATLRSTMGNDLTGLGEKISVLRYVLDHFPLHNRVTSEVLCTLAGPRQIESIRHTTLKNVKTREFFAQVTDDELFRLSNIKYALLNIFRRIWRRIKKK